jgi:uncharacterized protein (TIGR00159 family)
MLDLVDPYLRLRWIDLLDILVVAALLWLLIQGIRRTRARNALIGLTALGVVFLFARQLDLQLTARLLQGFFAVLVVILVVVFHEDLRRLLEQVALVGLRRRAPPPAGTVETVVRTIGTLARTRVGALIVIPGRESVDRHTEGGIEIDARLSEPLLLSLFDPNSPGHDGAVVLRGSRISAFAVHLPLSTESAGGGTRHAAALGLAERCDALCVVVSEERGTISLAHNAAIRQVDGEAGLTAELSSALTQTPGTNGAARVRWRWKEGLAAMGLAIALWLLVIPGAGVVEVQREVPVSVTSVPRGFTIEGIEPPRVQVTLAGRRTDLFLPTSTPQIRLDGLQIRLGRRRFDLTRSDVEVPPGIEVLAVEPPRVQVSVRTNTQAEPTPNEK